jgi:pSer/pThr/pTyr-binding forkhead associated (FHA) protein
MIQAPRQGYAYAPPPARDYGAPASASAAAPAPDWRAPSVAAPRVPEMDPRVPVAPTAAPAAPAPHADEAGATRYASVPATPRGRLAGVLIGVEGDDLVGEVFRIFDGENKLGRSRDCSVKLASEFISREHALLIHQDGVFAIRPLKDENPVLVNGEKTEGSALQDGDLIRLGRTTFRFRTA